MQVVLWPGTRGEAKAGPGLIPGALILETSDCKGTVARLRARGVAVEGDVVEQPAAFVAIVKDPDGNRLTLREDRG